jgi:Probable cobalt transporter subunit (CbtA)
VQEDQRRSFAAPLVGNAESVDLYLVSAVRHRGHRTAPARDSIPPEPRKEPRIARGRVRARSDLWLSVGLAGALFAAVVLVPFVNYPAAPPGVGDPATITERTLLYLTVVATSLLALLAAWRAARSVPERAASWLRPVAGLGVFAATAAMVAFVLPAVEEAPESFPSDLLWDFRLTSLGVQVVLWASLGLAFGIGVRRARLGARTG